MYTLRLNRKVLKHWLVDHELTQEAFAERLDVSPSALSLWFSGQRGARPEVIATLIMATGLSFETLFEIVEAKRARDAARQQKAQEETNGELPQSE